MFTATPTATGRRAPSRFPRPAEPSTSPARTQQVVWHGPDDALARTVADHVEAAGAGILPADASGPQTPGTDAGRSGPAVHVLAADALAETRPDLPEDATVLVVSDRPVDEHVWRTALTIGARGVLRLPGESEQLLSLLTESLRPAHRALTIGVTGGCGGAGASSLAARLAGAGIRRDGPDSCVLIDADPWGGGLDLLVEAPAPSGARWEDLGGIEQADGDTLLEGLCEVDGVRLLVSDAGTGAGPAHAAADGDGALPDAVLLDQVLTATGRIDGTVVVDLADHLVATAAGHLDRLLIVLPARDHALRACARRLARWDLPPRLGEVVLHGRGPVRGTDVTEDLALPTAGSFRDYGPGTVPLLDVRRRGADRWCRRLLDRAQDAA
jgi:hypothetical protein